MARHEPPEAFVGGQFRIVCQDTRTWARRRYRAPYHVGQRQQGLEAGRKGYKAVALVVIKCGISECIPGQQKLALSRDPRRPGPNRPEGVSRLPPPSDRRPGSQDGRRKSGELRGQMYEGCKKRTAVVQSGGADHRAALSAHGLRVKCVFRVHLKQQDDPVPPDLRPCLPHGDRKRPWPPSSDPATVGSTGAPSNR